MTSITQSWNPGLIVLHVVADGLIALAYFAIAGVVFYFVRARRDTHFRLVFLLFGLFIVAGGATHLMAVFSFWYPSYWAIGIVKAFAAALSIGTVLLIIPILPRALTLESPEELDRINRALETTLEEKERLLAMYEREHRVAGELQRAFLPVRLPDVPGLAFDADYEAGVAESDIGGDWYDAFPLADGRLAISIGDVAGRGLHAAVTMGKVRQSFRVCALQDFDTAKAATFAEKMLELYDPGAMVTAFFAVFDPLTRELMYTNAGHPPPILVDRDGRVTMLGGTSPPLGIVSKAAMSRLTLELDSLLVLYTDGLVESRHDIVADTERLVEVIHAIRETHPAHPARAIRAAMLEGPAKDDVAILVLSVLADATEPIDVTLAAVPESLRAARLVLRRFAYSVGCGEERVRVLETAAGEAISNVIEHAYGIEPGTVRIVARAENGNIFLEVEDRGQWRPPRDEGRGRGIPMIKLLATDFRLERGPSRHRALFSMPIAEPQWAFALEGKDV